MNQNFLAQLALLSNLDFFDGTLSLLIHADNFMYESLLPAISQHKGSVHCSPWLHLLLVLRILAVS